LATSTRNGILDVVYLTEGGAVNVYNTQTGNQLPGWPQSVSLKSNPKTPSPALADFEGDGFLEIVVANNAQPASSSSVQVYDYQGNVRPGWPIVCGGFHLGKLADRRRRVGRRRAGHSLR
jgi:hypothetical protein